VDKLTVAIDLAKNAFEVAVADSRGKVVIADASIGLSFSVILHRKPMRLS